MTIHETSSSSDGDLTTEWNDLTAVETYINLADAQEHALVILAMKQTCCVSADSKSSTFTLHAEPHIIEAITRELRLYNQEQAEAKVARAAIIEPIPFHYSAAWNLYRIWATILILIHFFKIDNPWIIDHGASSNTAIIKDHEWWRPFTAMFLHSDFSHLLGNLISGMLFVPLVCKSIGPFRGWLFILLCGYIGNLTTALSTWPEQMISIGASTAVFGALGILSGLGFAYMLLHQFRLPVLRIAAPVLGGLIILSWFGSGSPGGNTDVLGHAFGFLSGLLLGTVHGYFKPNDCLKPEA